MLPTKFQINWPFGSGEEAKIKFSRWPPLWPSWISVRNDFSHYLSTSQSDASYKVQVNWLFGVGGEAKNKCSRCPSWISDRNDFLIYKSSRCFLQNFESIGLLVQKEKQKIDFQDGGHQGFSIGTILAIFNLQVIPMLLTKFGVNFPRV